MLVAKRIWALVLVLVLFGAALAAPSPTHAQSTPIEEWDYILYCTPYTLSGTWPVNMFDTCQQIPTGWWALRYGNLLSGLDLVEINASSTNFLPCRESWNLDLDGYMAFTSANPQSDYALVYRFNEAVLDSSAAVSFYAWSPDNELWLNSGAGLPNPPDPLAMLRFTVYIYDEEGELVSSNDGMMFDQLSGVTKGGSSIGGLWSEYHTVYLPTTNVCLHGGDYPACDAPPAGGVPVGSMLKVRFSTLAGNLPAEHIQVSGLAVGLDNAPAPMCPWSPLYTFTPPIYATLTPNPSHTATPTLNPTYTPPPTSPPIYTTITATPSPTPNPEHTATPTVIAQATPTSRPPVWSTLPAVAMPTAVVIPTIPAVIWPGINVPSVPAAAALPPLPTLSTIPGVAWPTITVPTVPAPNEIVPLFAPTYTPNPLTPTPAPTYTPAPTVDSVATLEAFSTDMLTRWAEPIDNMYPYVVVITDTAGMTATSGISGTVEAMNYLIEYIPLPVRFFKAVQFYSPATWPFWSVLFVSVTLIITSYFAKFGFSIAMFVIDVLRKIWEMIPFN